MDSISTGWLFALCLVGVALYLGIRLRGESSRVDALALDVDRLDAELRSSRAQLEKNSARQRRQAEQEAEIRRKLEKARKRASQARGAEKSGGDELKRLETQLRLREADVKGLREELARGSEAPAAPRPAPAASPVVDPKSGQLEAENAQLRSKLESLESAMASRAEAQLTNEKELARVRGKLATQEKLYLSIHGELEAKKDRLKTQTEELERLRAYKVAVIDPLPGQRFDESTQAGPDAESQSGIEGDGEGDGDRDGETAPENLPESS